MIEENLIRMLSDESEKVNDEQFDHKLLFDNEICAWKHIRNQISPEKHSVKPAGFRIRVVESRGQLTRSSSSTVNSSNDSRSNSPGGDSSSKPMKKIRKRVSFNSNYISETVNFAGESNEPVNIIRIYKPTNPRRQRKPIKVFRLPRVEQGEEE